MMALGVLELLILVAVIALILRGAANGHLVYWLAAISAIVLVVGLVLAVVWGYQRQGMEQPRAQVDYQALADDLAERRARGEVIPDMYGELTNVPEVHGEAATWVKGGVFLLVLMLPMAAFGALRAHRRGGAGTWLIAGGSVAAMLLIGLFTVRVSRVSYSSYPPLSTPVVVATETLPHGAAVETTVAADQPADELWDRLTEPQIKFEEDPPTTTAEADDHADTETVAEQTTEVEDGAVVATMVAESGADGEAVSEAADHAHIEDEGEDVSTTAADADSVAEAAVATTEDVAEQDEVEDADVSAADAPAETADEIVEDPARQRPDWVDYSPRLAGPVQRVVIEAGPYATLTECHGVLRDEMARVVLERVQELATEWLGRPAYVPHLESMRLGNAFIVRELLADEPYVEVGQASFGETKTAWALLEFDPADDARLLAAWQGYARRDGIGITIACSALVLAVLGLVFGLIKVDTWTRGYYTKRLFLGVPAAIIAVVMLLAAANS
jgi:hypothetical protein